MSNTIHNQTVDEVWRRLKAAGLSEEEIDVIIDEERLGDTLRQVEKKLRHARHYKTGADKLGTRLVNHEE